MAIIPVNSDEFFSVSVTDMAKCPSIDVIFCPIIARLMSGMNLKKGTMTVPLQPLE